MKNDVTLDDIAAEAGVSVATVSRSLRHNSRINPKTRARILEISMKLGYQGASRKGIQQKRGAYTLGVLLTPNLLSSGFSATARYLQGITAEADVSDCLLRIEELSSAAQGRVRERNYLPKMIRDRLVDLVIVQGPHRQEDIAYLKTLVPVISLSREYEDVDLVEASDGRGIRAVVGHLASLGHRKLVWVREYYDAPQFYYREAGFFHSCIEQRIPYDPKAVLRIPPPDAPWDEFRCKLQHFVEGGFTAFACTADRVAVDVAEQLSQLGVAVPKQVSLTGYDADTMVDGRRLTSFDPGFIELGRSAIRVALQRLSDPGARPILQSRLGTLIVGETTYQSAQRL